MISVSINCWSIFPISELRKGSFRIQKLHHFYKFWIQKFLCPFSWFLEAATFPQFLDCHYITCNDFWQVVRPLLPTNELQISEWWWPCLGLGWWPQGHHPNMVTIIHLSQGCTQPVVHSNTIRWTVPLEFFLGAYNGVFIIGLGYLKAESTIQEPRPKHNRPLYLVSSETFQLTGKGGGIAISLLLLTQFGANF